MPVAIVTGGSRGLGLALTTRLDERGWDVVVDGRRADVLADAMRGRSDRVHAVPGDVRDETHRKELVARAEQLGGIDVVVNNAGDLGPSPLPALADLEPGAFREVLDANVVAPLALIQLALPSLLARGGAVVDITSDAGVEAYEGWGAYGASKAALEHLSHVLAVEHPDLRVWWVDPGDMRTDMHQAAFPGEDISDRPEPEASVPGIVALLETRPPSGRYVAREVTP